jgi:hypothetical protein
MQLPAHLQNRQIRSLTERAAEGMGSTLPPHISIQGNSFTFIDAAGAEYQPVLTFDATIVDVSDHLNKRYFDKPYVPGQDTGEPPACWSANGIAPSREAVRPQAVSCDVCPHNERGSKISALSGAAIKACRDERWIAVLVPQMPQMIFQLVITPGSFKNWKAYTETFRNYGVELSLGLTRFSFKPKVNGELLFEHVGWIDEPTVAAVEATVREKKTDAIVGRNDQPRVAALAAPAAQQTLPPPNQFGTAQPMQITAPQQEVIPPGTPFAQPAAAFPAPMHSGQSLNPSAMSMTPNTVAPGGGATTASPSEQPVRRRRRTQAEIAAANAPQQVAQPAPAAQGFVPAAAPQQAAFQPAPPQPPFPVASGPVQAAPVGAPQFGMAPGAPVNAEMAAMLAQMGFGKQG